MKNEQMMNDYGYYKAGRYHYYVKDYQGNVRAVVDDLGEVEEFNHYYPYGALFGTSYLTAEQPLKYGAKELERENGLDWYDSRARWYDPLTVTTPTLDPLLEKYYPFSPHLWCAGNPIRNTDPDGKEIYISGKSEDAAYEQLSLKFDNDNFSLIYGKDGAVSYKINNNTKLTNNQKRLASIIDDKNIIVNLYTVDGLFTTDNHLMAGGAFMGCEYDNYSGIVTTYQQVNPYFLRKIDDAYSTNGVMLFHEITESYEGGLLAKSNKTSIPMAKKDDINDPNSYYNRAHRAATPQHVLYEQYQINGEWQNSFNMHDIIDKVRWIVINNNTNTIIDILE